MSIKYHLIERVDPRDPDLARKYYAKIKNGDKVKFKDLVDLIAQFSTFNHGEIYGVIITLMQVMHHQLNYGRPIQLGDFGTFYVTLESDGKESEEAFLNSDIKGARIRFRPGISFKNTLRGIDFEKAPPSGKA